jgi:hypothetical protein
MRFTEYSVLETGLFGLVGFVFRFDSSTYNQPQIKITFAIFSLDFLTIARLGYPLTLAGLIRGLTC